MMLPIMPVTVTMMIGFRHFQINLKKASKLNDSMKGLEKISAKIEKSVSDRLIIRKI